MAEKNLFSKTIFVYGFSLILLYAIFIPIGYFLDTQRVLHLFSSSPGSTFIFYMPPILACVLTSLFFTLKVKEKISWKLAFIAVLPVPITALFLFILSTLVSFLFIPINNGSYGDTRFWMLILIIIFSGPIILSYILASTLILKISNLAFLKLFEQSKKFQITIFTITAAILALIPLSIYFTQKAQETSYRNTGNFASVGKIDIGKSKYSSGFSSDDFEFLPFRKSEILIVQRSSKEGELPKYTVFDTNSKMITRQGRVPYEFGSNGELSMTRLKNGEILLIGDSNKGTGGHGSVVVFGIFDPTQGSFNKVVEHKLSTSSHTKGFSTIELRDGRVLITGCYNNSNDHYGSGKSACLFNPRDNSISSAGNLSDYRRLPLLALLKDDRVIVVGNKDSEIRPIEIYDPKTNRFILGENFPADISRINYIYKFGDANVGLLSIVESNKNMKSMPLTKDGYLFTRLSGPDPAFSNYYNFVQLQDGCIMFQDLFIMDPVTYKITKIKNNANKGEKGSYSSLLLNNGNVALFYFYDGSIELFTPSGLN